MLSGLEGAIPSGLGSSAYRFRRALWRASFFGALFLSGLERDLSLRAALALVVFLVALFMVFLIGFRRLGLAMRDTFRVTARGAVRAGLTDWAGASLHPWASRTAIILRRISFQVPNCIITALGNMQPSQQIWRKALVGWPLSFLSQ